MRKIIKNKQNLSFDIINIITIVSLYLLNNACLKNVFRYTDIGWFFVGYFNDLICPIGFLSYLNIIYSCVDYRIQKISEILLWMLVAGLVWEFIAPMIKSNSVTDVWDLICYQLGGVLYYCILKMHKKLKKR